MGPVRYLLLLLVLMLTSFNCHSWGWFSSSEETTSNENLSGHREAFGGKFSMEGLHLFAGCTEIFAVEDKRSRFAWYLSDCFQKDSGRPSFPSCNPKSSMHKCLQGLNDNEHKVYLEFYLETNSICHQLQAQVFKHETERLVNELKNSAQYAEGKLETIEQKAEYLLQGSNQLFDSLNSIDLHTQQVALTAKNVEDHVDMVLQHSSAVYEQSRKIQASQSELKEGQIEMKRNLNEGMSMLQDSYSHLGHEINNLRNETVEIEKEITKVGDQMSSRMENLQNKSEDIENMAGVSLEKQQQLLDGQTTALKDLQFLTKFQSEALEESRNTLQRLAEYGRKEQEELLQRQQQLQQAHDHLMENSKSILAAQESFESKQASMFIALDKLFALHNSMLLESRIIKAFFIYSLGIFVIYMFTSTKQTYTVRPWIYLGLCSTFLIEVAIIRMTVTDIDQQTWKINLFRSIFAVIALAQLIHAIFTYRDYEVLNHQLLNTLMEKVNGMQRYQKLSWDNIDSDLNWSSWIEENLPEDVDSSEDPDYIVPEEVGENFITASAIKEYDLRQRQRLLN